MTSRAQFYFQSGQLAPLLATLPQNEKDNFLVSPWNIANNIYLFKAWALYSLQQGQTVVIEKVDTWPYHWDTLKGAQLFSPQK